MNRSSRLRRRVAFAWAIIASGCIQIALLNVQTSFATVPAAQKQAASNSNDRRADQNSQNDDNNPSRPRRVEAPTDPVQYASAEGPIIRVALMTDVTTVALSGSTGLLVRRSTADPDDGKKIAGDSLIVELRHRTEPTAPLKAKQRASSSRESDPLADTNARAAKYKAQPGSLSAHPSLAPDRHAIQLIAIAQDKIAASSEDGLIVSPVSSTGRLDRIDKSAPPHRGDQSGKRASGPDQKETAEPDAETAPVSSSVRIGTRNYRGEICLVLNSRGQINVVNALPLEEYLRGVVPMELSPAAYPQIEALKAQAVAARSYALAHLGRHRDEGFDLVDDTRAQVYGGLSAERELSNRAIAETRGIAAVFVDDAGKLTPIEALYTANCGGRTENNEEVFGGKSVPYLRAVSCTLDRQSFEGRDIVSSQTREPMIGFDGRSIAREVALLSVLGFSISRRAGVGYLSRPPDPDEVKDWIDKTARLIQRDKPPFARGDVTRLAEFAHLVTLSVYGEGRARTLLAPADVDYMLTGLRTQNLPGEARAEMAMLLKDGIVRLAGDAIIDGRAQITRGQAIEILARAISMTSRPSDPKSQISDPRYRITNISNLKSRTPSLDFKSEIAAPSENGRLIVPSQSSNPEINTHATEPRFTSVNTSGSGRVTRPPQDDWAKGKSASAPTKNASAAPTTVRADVPRDVHPGGLEISETAWLFRTLGGESHQVERLTMIGGERVAYHLNAKGQVDFLEASLSDRSASSDGFASVAQWQERIPIEELQQRLARARINIGRVERIEPVAFTSSGRVSEVEVTGSERSVRLRRPQIRAALGLKEYLFVVDRESDAQGQIVAFVFTGRGWGHGVGMCQTGAYGLAKGGYSYTAILQKYYTGVKLHKMF